MAPIVRSGLFFARFKTRRNILINTMLIFDVMKANSFCPFLFVIFNCKMNRVVVCIIFFMCIFLKSGIPSVSWRQFKPNNLFTIGPNSTYSNPSLITNRCSNTNNQFIFNTNRITIYAINYTTICEGDSVQLITQYTNGLSYQWYLVSNTKSGSILAVTGEISSSFYATKSGEYLLVVKDVLGASCITNSITVTVNPNPIVTILANGDLSFCPGSNVILSAITSPFTNFLWSNGNTHQSISVTNTGSFCVIVTNPKDGCSSISPTISTALYNLRTDINVDGITDYSDYLLLIQQFNNSCSNCSEDIDLDGVVNNEDFLKLLGDYSISCN